MIWDYTLKPITYDFHNRGVQLVELIGDTLDKYLEKDRAHGTVLINLWPVSHGNLMEPRDVQQESHTSGTQ